MLSAFSVVSCSVLDSKRCINLINKRGNCMLISMALRIKRMYRDFAELRLHKFYEKAGL